MTEIKIDRRDGKGRFLPGNKNSMKHGAWLLKVKATGAVPSLRGAKFIRADLARIRGELEAAMGARLTIQRQLLISQICRTEAQLRLIELYLHKSGIIRSDRAKEGIIDLQPCLSTSYISFLNTQRVAIVALGLEVEKVEAILTPYEVVERENVAGKTPGGRD